MDNGAVIEPCVYSLAGMFPELAWAHAGEGSYARLEA